MERRILSIGQSYAAHVDDAVFHLQRVLALIRVAFLEAGRGGCPLGLRALWSGQRTSSTRGVVVWSPGPDHASLSQSDASCGVNTSRRLAPPPFIPATGRSELEQ